MELGVPSQGTTATLEKQLASLEQNVSKIMVMLNQHSSEYNPPVSRDTPMSSCMPVGNVIPPSPIPVSLSSSLPVYLWGSNTDHIVASTPVSFASTSSLPAIVSTPPAIVSTPPPIVSTPPAIVSTSLSLASSSNPLPAPCMPLGYDPDDPGSWLDDDTLSSILDEMSRGDSGVTSVVTVPTAQLQTPLIMQPQIQPTMQPQIQPTVQPQTQPTMQPPTQI